MRAAFAVSISPRRRQTIGPRRSPCDSGVGSRTSWRVRARLDGDRHEHAERGALARAALHLDAAVVREGEVAHEREPDAAALRDALARLRVAPEAVEDAAEVLGGDADAGVGHLQHRLALADGEAQATVPPGSV